MPMVPHWTAVGVTEPGVRAAVYNLSGCVWPTSRSAACPGGGPIQGVQGAPSRREEVRGDHMLQLPAKLTLAQNCSGRHWSRGPTSLSPPQAPIRHPPVVRLRQPHSKCGLRAKP